MLLCRFLVLCQTKMPGTFTVKAGFGVPGGGQQQPDLASPELEAVEPEYIDTDLGTVLGLGTSSQEVDPGLASRVLASRGHSATQRRYRAN